MTPLEAAADLRDRDAAYATHYREGERGAVLVGPIVADAIWQPLTYLAVVGALDPEAQEAVARIVAILDALGGPAVAGRAQPIAPEPTYDVRTAEACIAIVQEEEAKGQAEPWWLVSQMECLTRIPMLSRLRRSDREFRTQIEPHLVAYERARLDAEALLRVLDGTPYGSREREERRTAWADAVQRRTEAFHAIEHAAKDAYARDCEHQNARDEYAAKERDRAAAHLDTEPPPAPTLRSP